MREIVARYGIRAEKSLGQNFLFDLNLAAKIARAAFPLDQRTVIEIGPGPGGLTRALLAAGAERIIAIERDPRCLAALEPLAEASGGRLVVIGGDALALDPVELSEKPRKIVANLPYNIATRLLLFWLQRIGEYESLTLMFQREVALRLVASAGTPFYGRLSVIVQWLCEARLLFDLPGSAFVPAPRVSSSVVALLPRESVLAPASKRALERVTAAAFGRRRKMLRQSLRALGVSAEALLEATGIAGTRRGEELLVEEFCALARAFEKFS